MSETAAEPPQDDGNSTNSPRNLALEATFINHNFSQQVLRKEDRFKFDEENPFAGGEDDEEEGEIASVGCVLHTIYFYNYCDLDINEKRRMFLL